MKVCYIFREKERGAHSIELLFDLISSEISKKDVIVEKWYRPLSKIKSIKEIRKLKADVYHITGDCYFLALFLPWKKTVMTIHDIGMYKNHPKTLKTLFFTLVSFIIPLNFHRVATVISQLTKDDLIKYLNIRANKLRIIPNPLVLPLHFAPKTFNKISPSIMQIGSGPHKNLENLVEAVKDISCNLIIVGSPNELILQRMHSLGIRYELYTNVNNEELAELYYKTDILYFASFSEGFGLPILEAQATGRPVITSNIEPMVSVAGQAACFVNPNSSFEIRDAIKRLSDDEQFRLNLISAGKDNLENFSTDKIVEQYMEVYKFLTKDE